MLKIALKYGGIMASLLLIYAILEAQWFAAPDHRSLPLFGIALLFTGGGIWAGLQLSNRTDPKHSPPKSAPEISPEELDIRPREMEILQLMAEGLSNQEIADQLFISLSTVKTHNMNLFTKLDVKRRTQAVSKAKELGLLV